VIPSKPKKKVFWTPELLSKFINDLIDFGVNRWEKFQIQREIKEMKQVSYTVLTRLEKHFKVNKFKFTNEVLYSITPPNEPDQLLH